jgi:hypothetical protein
MSFAPPVIVLQLLRGTVYFGFMSAANCNISRGNVTVSGGSLLSCDGASVPTPVTVVRIFGSATSNSILIEGSRVQLELQSLSIRSETGLTVSASTVSIIFTGINALSATAERAAAIGCLKSSNLSFIGLNGSLNANGAMWGDGIGPGQNEACESLVFVNGTFGVRAGLGGVGTGSGRASTGNSTLSTLTISGGNVTASGPIGSGYSDTHFSSIGNLTISGGNVSASTSSGSAIGSAIGGNAESAVSNLVISGGNVSATSSGASGIGSGPTNPSYSSVLQLTICGGNIVARGRYGAGIGSSYSNNRPSTVFNLTICGGNVTASGSDGAGIGAGPAPGFSTRDGSSHVVNLVISGGNITASGSNAAGIGSGYAFRGDSAVFNLTISGGNISADGAGGAGIGSGLSDGTASSFVLQLAIVNGSFDLRASSPYPGIGTQPLSSSRDTVTVFNGFFDCSALNATSCFNSSSLTFQDGNITAITNYRTVGPSTQSRIAGFPSLYFEYLSASSREEITGLPIIHFDAIQLEYRAIYGLTIRQEEGNGGTFERELTFNRSRSQGCAFTVDTVGNYSIFFSANSPPLAGRLGHDGITWFLAAGAYDNFYSATPLYFPSESAPPTSRHTPAPTGTISATIHATSSREMTDTPTITAAPSDTTIPVDSRQATSRFAPSDTTIPVDSRQATSRFAPNDTTIPVDSQGGQPSMALIVSLTILAFLVVVFSGALAVWWCCRHRRLSEGDYRTVTESYFDVHID